LLKRKEKKKLKMVIILLFLTCILVALVDSHGNLADPIPRRGEGNNQLSGGTFLQYYYKGVHYIVFLILILIEKNLIAVKNQNTYFIFHRKIKNI